VSLLFQRHFLFHLFFPCVLYYIKLHYITLSYYLVYASLLSLLQLFFCLHVRLLYVIKYYLLTYLLSANALVPARSTSTKQNCTTRISWHLVTTNNPDNMYRTQAKWQQGIPWCPACSDRRHSRALADRTGLRWRHQSKDTCDFRYPSDTRRDGLHVLMTAADTAGSGSPCRLGILHPVHTDSHLLIILIAFKTFLCTTRNTKLDFQLHLMQKMVKR